MDNLRCCTAVTMRETILCQVAVLMVYSAIVSLFRCISGRSTIAEIYKDAFASVMKIKLDDKMMAVKHMQILDPKDVCSELAMLR